MGEARRRGRRSARRRVRAATASRASRSVSAALARVSSSPRRRPRRRRSRRWRARSRCPARRARSCAPPTTNGGNAQPAPHQQRGRALRAAELVAGDRAEVGAQARRSRRRRGPRPRTRRRARRASLRARTRSTTAAAGCSVPTSWLASCTDTSAVSGRIAAATSSGSKRPSRSTPTVVTSVAPARHRVEHRRVLDRGGDDVPAAAARRARPRPRCSTASVPLAVNTTSRGRAPKRAATCSRAVSTATRVAWPSACRRPGSPWWSRR